MTFKDKNIVITGASGGMGCILSAKLEKEGASLAVCSNDSERLKDLEKEVSAIKVSAVLDITNEAEVESFIKEAGEKMGRLDYLVNLAGLSIPTNYTDIDEANYELIMNVNVKGSMLASKHFAKYANNPALIINVGSMAAINTNANAPVYCMAKAAVNKLSEGLLLQLGRQGIRVTTVNPGGADTPFWGERKVDRTKLMSAQNVADIIFFIMSVPSNIQVHSIAFESFAKFN